MGSVQLYLPLQDDERLGLSGVQVGGYALVRLSGHFAEGPPITGFTRCDQLAQRRVSTGCHLAIARTDDSHPVQLVHGRILSR